MIYLREIKRRFIFVCLILSVLLVSPLSHANPSEEFLNSAKEILRARILYHLQIKQLLEDERIPIEDRYLQFLGLLNETAEYEERLKENRASALLEAQSRVANLIDKEARTLAIYKEILHQRQPAETESILDKIRSLPSKFSALSTEDRAIFGNQHDLALRRMYLETSSFLEQNQVEKEDEKAALGALMSLGEDFFLNHVGQNITFTNAQMKKFKSKATKEGPKPYVPATPENFVEAPFLEYFLDFLEGYPNMQSNIWIDNFDFTPENFTFSLLPLKLTPHFEKPSQISANAETHLSKWSDFQKRVSVIADQIESTCLTNPILPEEIRQNQFACNFWQTGGFYSTSIALTLTVKLSKKMLIEALHDEGITVSFPGGTGEVKKKKKSRKPKKSKLRKSRAKRPSITTQQSQLETAGQEEEDDSDDSIEEEMLDQIAPSIEKLTISSATTAAVTVDSEIEEAMRDAQNMFDIFRSKKRKTSLKARPSELDLTQGSSLSLKEDDHIVRLKKNFQGSQSQKLLLSLFDKASENISFNDLETLVNRAEGKITFNAKGGSHFTLELPGAIAFPWAPHGGKTRFSDHSLEIVRRAFITAGITPENLGF